MPFFIAQQTGRTMAMKVIHDRNCTKLKLLNCTNKVENMQLELIAQEDKRIFGLQTSNFD